MSEPERYPPPDFSCPPPNFIQQQQPGSSSFHPSMWSWGETPSEPSWGGFHQERPSFNQHFGGEWYQAGHPGARQNHRPPYQHGKKQRNRKEPEYSYFCDTCDRGFKNQQKYDEHVVQHVKCSVPDCSFMAHEKLVAIHWKNNHAPGTKRIKLDTPEEVAKWREERRKNYPTLQNIEKKKKVMEVREQTGGVLETAQFGRMRGRGRCRGRGRGWGNRGFRGQHKPETFPLSGPAAESPKPLCHPSKEGDPLGVLASANHDSDTESTPEHGSLVVAPKQMSSALGSLLANYGSTSESDEEPEVAPIQRARKVIQENQTLLNGISPASGDSGASKRVENRSETRTVPKPSSGPNVWHDRKRGRGGRGRRYQDMPPSRRATLLEMLLAPDIRHERNVLLQCVRYVVRNHFFGLESKSQRQEDVKHKNLPASATNELGWSSKVMPASQSDSIVHDERHSEGVVVTEEGHIEGLNGESAGRTEGGADSVRSIVEKTATAHNSQDPTGTNKILSTSNVYDDEIWEIEDAVL